MKLEPIEIKVDSEIDSAEFLHNCFADTADNNEEVSCLVKEVDKGMFY